MDTNDTPIMETLNNKLKLNVLPALQWSLLLYSDLYIAVWLYGVRNHLCKTNGAFHLYWDIRISDIPVKNINWNAS